MEKAFDRLEWDIIKEMVDRMKLGRKIAAWLDAVYKELFATIRVNDLDSHPISLSRGVRQGYPMSPLLFNISLKALMTAIRKDNLTTGPICNGKQSKLAQYAEDMGFFLTNPTRSFLVLAEHLRIFHSIAGYKINKEKSELMALNLSEDDKEIISKVSKATWKERNIRYLGIRFAIKTQDTIMDNLSILLQSVK